MKKIILTSLILGTLLISTFAWALPIVPSYTRELDPDTDNRWWLGTTTLRYKGLNASTLISSLASSTNALFTNATTTNIHRIGTMWSDLASSTAGVFNSIFATTVNLTNINASTTNTVNLNVTGMATSTDIFLTELNNSVVNGHLVTKEHSGFADYTQSTISFSTSTRTFTISPLAGSSYDYYLSGIKFTTTTPASVVIPNVAGQLNYIYFDNDLTGNIVQSTDPWNFWDAQIATVYWNGSDALIGFDRHGVTMDWATHKYLHNTIGTRYQSGLTGTYTDTGFSMTAGIINDEDNIDDISATTSNRLLYRTPSYMTFTSATTSWYYKIGADIQYDNGGTLTPMGANQYSCSYVYATNERTNPIYTFVGQAQYATIALARAGCVPANLALGNLVVPEMKLLYIVILRNDATPYEETIDYRATAGGLAGTFTPTDHGTLTGLADDDHTQYAILSAVRGVQTFLGDLIFNNIKSSRLAVGTTATSSMVTIQGEAGISALDVSSSTGSSLLKVASNGSVGIGTTSPYAKLSIHDSSGLAGTNPIFVVASSTSGNTGTTTLLSVLGNGNVGINGSPTGILSVYGDRNGTGPDLLVSGANVTIGRSSNTSGNNTTFMFKDRLGNIKSQWDNASSGNIKFALFGAGYGMGIGQGITDAQTTATLNVRGVGSNSSYNALSVFNTQLQPILVARNDGLIGIGMGSSTLTATLNIKGTTTLPTTDLLNISSSTNDSLFNIKPSGNVGIGTSSPTNKLEVNGSGFFNGLVTAISGLFTNATTTNLAITGITNSILATDGSGNVIATSTPTATNYWTRTGTTLSPYFPEDDISVAGYSTFASTTISPMLTVQGTEGDYTKMGIKLQDSAFITDGFAQLSFIPKTIGETLSIPYNVVGIFGYDNSGNATSTAFVNLGPIIMSDLGASLSSQSTLFGSTYVPVLSGLDSDSNEALYLKNYVGLLDLEDDGGGIVYRNNAGDQAILAFAPTAVGEDYPTMTYIGLAQLLGGTKMTKTASSTITGFMDTLQLKGKSLGISEVGSVSGIQFIKSVGTGFGTEILSGFLGSVLTDNSADNYSADMVMYTQATSTQSIPTLSMIWKGLTGWVGIGTSTPVANLQVASSTGTTTVAYGWASTTASTGSKQCFWNGANWTIEYYPPNSVTKVVATSTNCN